MILDDPAQFAEDLKKMGIDACHQILYGLHGGMEGLDIGDEFFPLWELSLPENQADLEKLDFAAIKARRGADWSVDPPHCARKLRLEPA
jgi:hypothetical protein